MLRSARFRQRHRSLCPIGAENLVGFGPIGLAVVARSVVSEEIRLFGGPCQVPLKRVLPSARFLSAVEKYSRARSPAFFPAGEGVLAMAVGISSIRF